MNDTYIGFNADMPSSRETVAKFAVYTAYYLDLPLDEEKDCSFSDTSRSIYGLV